MNKNLPEQALEMIESFGDDFDQIMTHYMNNGYVYISPTCFILAEYKNENLFVYLVIGELNELMSKIHFTPTTISFYRNNGKKQKCYDYAKFVSKLKK